MFTRRSALTLLSATAVLPLISAQAHAAKNHTVRINGHAFSPRALKAKIGDTVTFVNQDAAPHTGTARDGSFDTGRLQQGQSGQVTLSAAGKVDYFCAVHPGMRGSITVS